MTATSPLPGHSTVPSLRTRQSLSPEAVTQSCGRKKRRFTSLETGLAVLCKPQFPVYEHKTAVWQNSDGVLELAMDKGIEYDWNSVVAHTGCRGLIGVAKNRLYLGHFLFYYISLSSLSHVYVLNSTINRQSVLGPSCASPFTGGRVETRHKRYWSGLVGCTTEVEIALTVTAPFEKAFASSLCLLSQTCCSTAMPNMDFAICCFVWLWRWYTPITPLLFAYATKSLPASIGDVAENDGAMMVIVALQSALPSDGPPNNEDETLDELRTGRDLINCCCLEAVVI